MILHIDIETYSSVDIRSSGLYKYCESIDFEILLVAYAFDDEDVQIVDLANGEKLPHRFIKALNDPNVHKHAHNANFERNAFKQIGYDIPIEQWYCSAVKTAYCGFPLSLDMASKAMSLGEKGKLSTGKALIRYFCVPCKPTQMNGFRLRNFAKHDPGKWEEFKRYCINDVEAEREITNKLERYSMPEFERINYLLDQCINDRGILIDLNIAKNAFCIDIQHAQLLSERMIKRTGLANPNSPAQLRKWLEVTLQKEIESLAKDNIVELIEESESGPVIDVLKMRLLGSKTSTKKYTAMLNCACADNRAHGLFQFYGANRTGRWAGRLVQLQNLPQNHLSDLDLARSIVESNDYDLMEMSYDNIPDVLSQLIRTAFIAKDNHTLGVADYSAIEARVLSWLANEKWRIDVFKGHGKIYEASASMMFNVPIEQITKGSDLRTKGKVAELALGYQGGVQALKNMGAEKMNLSHSEMQMIVDKWRKANPKIVKLWDGINNAAIRSIKERKKVVLSEFRNITFEFDGSAMTIKLPSGRKLFYQSATVSRNRFGSTAVKYKGVDNLKKWWWVDSYGGKFVENIVQAISRDVLAYAMQKLNDRSFDIVMHVHDEIACEINKSNAEAKLVEMCDIMGTEIPWAKGLPLKAEGYVTHYYKKD